jgi:hypothetical protein
MKTLREEIMQAHSTRSELLKWKLVIVGAIGSVGLGLAGANTAKHADLVLAAIPLVCIYVDLLCMNLNLRILAIASWMRKEVTDDSEQKAISRYEAFLEPHRRVFALEDWAISGGTFAVSAAVVIYGIAGADGGASIAFVTSGAVGVLGSGIAWGAYLVYRKQLAHA